jgi:hypothetical protein
LSFGSEKSTKEVSAINNKEMVMYSLTIFKSELLHKFGRIVRGKMVCVVLPRYLPVFPSMSGATGVFSSTRHDGKSKTDFIQLVVARFITCCDSECCDMKLVRIRNQAALGIYPEVVERLIMKNPSQYPWSAEVKGLSVRYAIGCKYSCMM